jgi:hypothetical protein
MLRAARVIPEAIAFVALVAPGLSPFTRVNAPAVVLCVLVMVETGFAIAAQTRTSPVWRRALIGGALCAARAMVCLLPMAAESGVGNTPWLTVAVILFALGAAIHASGAWARTPGRAAVVLAAWSLVWVLPFAASLGGARPHPFTAAIAPTVPMWCPYAAITTTALTTQTTTRPWLYANTPYASHALLPRADAADIAIRFLIVAGLFAGAALRERRA